MQIKALRKPYVKKDKDGKETKMPGGTVTANFDFGDNLAALVQKFGEQAVYKNAIGALKVAFQGWLRSQMEQGKSQDEINSAATNWKPNERKQGKTPAEKLREAMSAMTPEERAALLAEFRSGGATAGGGATGNAPAAPAAPTGKRK